MTGFWADLAALLRNPRRWWYRATHAPCPECGEQIDVGRWFEHKRQAHGPSNRGPKQ